MRVWIETSLSISTPDQAMAFEFFIKRFASGETTVEVFDLSKYGRGKRVWVSFGDTSDSSDTDEVNLIWVKKFTDDFDIFRQGFTAALQATAAKE